MAEMSTAERIAALTAGTGNAPSNVVATESAVPPTVVTEQLPDCEMNIPPHLIAQAATITQQGSVNVGATVQVQGSGNYTEDVTVTDMVENGIPRELAEQLTPKMIGDLARLCKNAYTRNWNRGRRVTAPKIGEHQALAVAMNTGKEIYREQAGVSLYGTPTKLHVPIPDKAPSLKVKTMKDIETENKIAALEKGVSEMTNLLRQIVGNQTAPNFAAPAAAPIAAPVTTPAPVAYTRLFTYVRKDKTLGANIAIEPLPHNVVQFHNSALLTPGNVANLWAMYSKDPAAFGENLKAAYEASIPYQYQKKNK